MVSNSHSSKARAYMRSHHGISYQQALAIVDSKQSIGSSVEVAPSELLTVLGIVDTTSYDPTKLWEQNRGTPSLRIPIGHRVRDKEVLPDIEYLDLAERVHGGDGPHGVIQGVTGSGKSHLLQNIVAALCTARSPEELSVLWVNPDKKSVTELCDMPHLVKAVKSVPDDRWSDIRLAKILNTELARRERLLRERGFKNLHEYFASNDFDTTSPPLSPFTFLVVEQIEAFSRNTSSEALAAVKEYLTRGHGLGVHVLLCGQYLDHGVFREAMEHLSYRISLRSGSAQASRTVLGTSDAAQLDIVDRFALIQKSTSSSSTLTKFRAFDTWRTEEGKLVPDLPTLATTMPEHNSTIERLSWLSDPLESTVVASPEWIQKVSEIDRDDDSSRLVPLAVMDRDGDGGEVEVYHVPLDEGTLILGGKGTGKTTAVVTLVTAASHLYPDVEWYVIGRDERLAALESFPTVVEYDDGRDPLRLLESFSVGLGDPECPRRVLVVEHDPSDIGREWRDYVNAVLPKHSNVGVLITTERELKIYDISSRMSRRVCLQVDDPNELAGSITRQNREILRSIPSNLCGVGVDPISSRFLRILLPTASSPEDIQKLGAYLSSSRGVSVEKKSKMCTDTPYPENAASPVIGRGVSEEVLLPIDFIKVSIVGTHGSGRTTALRTVLRSALLNRKPENTRVVIMDESMELLGEANNLRSDGYLMDKGYLSVRDDALPALDTILSEIKKRNPRECEGVTPAQIRDGSWYDGPDFYVFVDGLEVANRGAVSKLMNAAHAHGVNVGLHMVVTCTDGEKSSLWENDLMAAGSSILLLSCKPSSSPMLDGVKRISLPPGRGRWFDTATSATKFVQVYRSDPVE